MDKGSKWSRSTALAWRMAALKTATVYDDRGSVGGLEAFGLLLTAQAQHSTAPHRTAHSRILTTALFYREEAR